MKTTLIGQGLTKLNHFSIIKDFFNEAEGKIIISSAYANSKAIRALSNHFKMTSLDITFFLGVRNGVTSKQALQEIIKTKANLYTIDTGKISVIYHPKNYFFYNEKLAKIVIGSANLTEGGLTRNIETGVLIEVDRSQEEDEKFLQELISLYDRLRMDFSNNVIKIETNEDIEMYYNNGIIEDENNRIFQEYGNSKQGSVKNTTPMKLFYEPIGVYKQQKKKVDIHKRVVLTIDSQLKTEYLTKLWETKPLTRRDLSIPASKGSHPTGSMLLKKGNSDIDQQTYFRQEAFADLPWVRSDSTHDYLEFATLECTIVTNGVSRGEYKLTIKNDTRTDTKSYRQKQATATLLWGEAREVISDEALLDAILRLYRVRGTNNFVMEFSN
ncbi:phospholipase D family protein [Enterococcus hulanensis]|uniref:phospholipase D family protein n=1 Tax=Enterococcus hulanensis TaxID=2559929 RepID=UPI001A8CC826|nr:phospholipase D family protein [Enterococcus hulanensis]MBO0457748.1 phospholipase D family protein [Enterococcus hulanensis]